MTTPHDDGGPIAPSMITRQRVSPDTISESRMDVEGGLTIRDWFAGMALQGWLASWPESGTHPISNNNGSTVAELSYSMADAMIAARKEES